MNVTQLSRETIQSNQILQEEFLNTLLKRNGSRIYHALNAWFIPSTPVFNELIGGDLQQAFLIGAHAALGKFREQDDGRGKNNCAGYCAWYGLKAVQDRVRQVVRESKRNAAELPTDMDAEANCRRSNVAGALRAHVYDPLESLISSDMIADFMDKLEPTDRHVAELLQRGYGPAQRNRMPGEVNRGTRRNYLKDLQTETGFNEWKLTACLKRLRKAAAAHWDIET